MAIPISDLIQPTSDTLSRVRRLYDALTVDEARQLFTEAVSIPMSERTALWQALVIVGQERNFLTTAPIRRSSGGIH